MRTSIRASTRFDVLSCHNFRCFYCGSQAPSVTLEIDHVIPVAKGGTNNPWNLVPACHDCNAGKTDSIPSQVSVVRARLQWNDFSAQRSRGRQWECCSYCSTPLPAEEDEPEFYECVMCNALACWAYENGWRASNEVPSRPWRPLDWLD